MKKIILQTFLKNSVRFLDQMYRTLDTSVYREFCVGKILRVSKTTYLLDTLKFLTPHPKASKTGYTVCLGSSDPFYIVTFYIKWVTTSWTYSIYSTNS